MVKMIKEKMKIDITFLKKSNLSKQGKQALRTLSILIILSLIFEISSKGLFLTLSNILTIALQTSIYAIIAIGQTYAIITSGIDLSIGSNIALSGVIATFLMANGVPIPIAILVGLLSGCITGLINGIIVAYADLPPFIATLGTMSVIRGAVLLITGGLSISNLPDAFAILGNGNILGIPIPTIIMVIIAIIFGFVLSNTIFGRYIYAIGSNFEAARLAGINNRRVLVMVYIVSGFLAACGGIILSSRVISGQPGAGAGYELDAVAASVIGGASLFGGKGSTLGAVLGAFVLGALKNGLNIVGISAFWQQVATGLILIAALYFDKLRQRTK